VDAEEREMNFRATGKHYDKLLETLRHAAYGGD
jgi:hypothetical protein